jgi:hypothetical protein
MSPRAFSLTSPKAKTDSMICLTVKIRGSRLTDEFDYQLGVFLGAFDGDHMRVVF